MISDLNKIYSLTAKGMQRSAIREILKLTQQPDIISFAGGLPAPESFPVKDINEISCEILEKNGTAALQYGTTEGFVPLREELLKRYRKEGLDVSLENLIITTSSQQGLDLLGKIFVDRGDKVICGLPSYLGGLSAFRTYGAEMIGIEFDEHGMRSDKLEKQLKSMKSNGEKPKFIYIIPDFQNPAGITMPEFRRREIIDLAHKYDVLIVEDSPYRELRFDGNAQPMMYQMDSTGHVITLGTFSKILAPGFRIGWVLAAPEIADKFVVAKQATDLCTPPFLQMIAAKYMEKGLLEKNLKATIDSYRIKRDTMLEGFKKYMPKGVTWTEPEGGLFLFLFLPEHMDSEKIFQQAIDQKVAYVIGSVFHCDGSGKNTMRLNFSFPSLEQNKEGVKRLAEVIKKNLK
ncbi:MAG: PLP-dependent aminotransferase family protein [Bacteroidales bacterium]|jgi:2-aminoadipate transaminase|nr:PLP-dependent aminotransferase family protein [Bacteroidales bacterium]